MRGLPRGRGQVRVVWQQSKKSLHVADTMRALCLVQRRTAGQKQKGCAPLESRWPAPAATHLVLKALSSSSRRYSSPRHCYRRVYTSPLLLLLLLALSIALLRCVALTSSPAPAASRASRHHITLQLQVRHHFFLPPSTTSSPAEDREQNSTC